MIKRIISYFLTSILSLTIVGGCINYTNTRTGQVTPAQEIEVNELSKSVSGYSDFRNPTPKKPEDNSVSSPVNVPRKAQDKEYPIISYSAYEVMYNPEYKIPRWVRYELLASETDGVWSRKGLKFTSDPSVNYPQAEDNDYRNSGWSRGHMAPAGDFKWSSTAMEETFYFTNCCPQNQALNAGQWSTLEKKVRNWANRYGSLMVYTGPIVLDNTYGTIGYNKVVVPDAFFKAILAGNQAIAFVMYNHNNNANLQKCAMSVDDLEALTGIDFFEELDDAFENQVESTFNLRNWGL